MAKGKHKIEDLLGAVDAKQWKNIGWPDPVTARDAQTLRPDLLANAIYRRVGSDLKGKALAAIRSASRAGKTLSANEIKEDFALAQKVGANNDTLILDYIAINKSVSLPGHLLSFSDSYAPKWNAEEVYGRMDPIVTYQGTQRKVELKFESDTGAEGAANAVIGARIGDIIKFMYPVYQDSSITSLGANTLSASPLLRISLAGSHFVSGEDGLIIAVDAFSIDKFNLSSEGEMGANRGVSSATSTAALARHRAEGLMSGFNEIIPIKYTITLGGYVFHADAKPGWVWTESDDAVSVNFGPGNKYPYGYPSQVITLAAPEAAGSGKSDPKGGSGASKVQANAKAKVTSTP